MDKKTLTFFSFAALSLAACGGGSSDSSPIEEIQTATPPQTNSPAPTQSPVDEGTESLAGVYYGEVTNDEGDFNIAALISSSGELRVISLLGEQLRGNIEREGDTFVIDPLLSFFTDDSESTNAIFSALSGSGTAQGDIETNRLTGSTRFGTFVSEFELVKDLAESNREASTAIIAGNYTTVNVDTSISIDSGGVLTGTDSDGCIYNGAVTASLSTVNVYDVVVSVDNCDINNSSFSGLGIYLEANEVDTMDAFTFQIDNGEVSITAFLEK